MNCHRIFLILIAIIVLIGSACDPPPPGNPGNGNGPWWSALDLNVSPCDIGETISAEELPDQAQEYLQMNHTDDPVVLVREYLLPDDVVTYGVLLESGEQLLFDEEGLLISQGGTMTGSFTLDDLPPPALLYLDNNFPGWSGMTYEIEGEDLYGSLFFTVSMDGDVVVTFSAEGNWLCGDEEENEEDEEDGNEGCSQENLLSLVTPWLEANIGGFEIDDIECEEHWCNEILLIEVELEDVDEGFYFDWDGNFLYTVTELDTDLFPEPVLSGVAELFPDYLLISDDVDGLLLLEDADGNGSYYLRFRPHPGNNGVVKLVIAADGTILCQAGSVNNGGNGNNNNDDEDDNEECVEEELLPAVTPWLEANVGDYEIDDIQCDDWCEETLLVQVELEDVEEEFYFAMDGSFLHTALDVELADLPTLVLTSFNNFFPDYDLEEEESDLDQMTLPDGSVAYRIKFSPANGYAKLVIAADGTILCENT